MANGEASPINPPPPPFSGPNPVTGSGRTAFIVPTFVPNRAGTLPAAAAPIRSAGRPATARPAAAAFGTPTVPATLSPYDDEEPPPDYTDEYADDGYGHQPGSYGAEADGHPHHYADEGEAGYGHDGDEYDDDDDRGHHPAGRGRGASGAPAKKGKGLLVVLLLLLLVGGGIGGYIAAFGIPAELLGTSTDTDNPNLISGNGGTTTPPPNGGTPPPNGTSNPTDPPRDEFSVEWITPPPRYTNQAVFRGRLKVKADYAVEAVMLHGKEILTPNAREFELPITLDVKQLKDEFVETHTLTFRPQSGANKPAKQFSFELDYDADPPTFALEGPFGGQSVIYQRERTFSLTLRASDSHPKRLVFDGQEFLPEKDDAVAISGARQFSYPSEGSYTITATAEDKAGNSATWRCTIIVDTTPPTIRVPSRGGLEWNTDRETDPIALVVEDSNGLASVTINNTNQRIDGSPRQSNLQFNPRLNVGLNEFRVEARDLAGNARQVVLRVTYTPQRAPAAQQINVDGAKMWGIADGPMPAEWPHSSAQETLRVAVYFDYFGVGQPRASINGETVTLRQSGGQGSFIAEQSVTLTGRQTEITIRLEGSSAADAQNFSFTVLREPFPGPIMPLDDVAGLDVERAFPPSGNVALSADQLAVDFALTAEGDVIVVIAGPPGKLAKYSPEGDELWSHALDAEGDAVLVVGDGRFVVARTADGKLRLLSADGQLVAELPVMSEPGSAWCAIDATRFAVQQPNGAVAVVDASTTSEPLVFPIPGRPSGPLVVIGQRRDLLLGRGGVTLISPIHRRPVWTMADLVTDLIVEPSSGHWTAADVTGQLTRRLGSRVVATQSAYSAGARLTMLPDGRLVSVGPTGDGDAPHRWIVWAADFSAPEIELDGPWIEKLAAGPDGRVWCLSNGYVVRLKPIR